MSHADNLLTAVRDAAFLYRNNHAHMVDVLRKAKSCQLKDIQRAFFLGYVASVLVRNEEACTDEAETKAEAVLKLANHKAGGSPHEYRNTAQQNMFVAAKMAWSRLSKLANILPVGKQGQNSKKRAPNSGQGKVDKPEQAPVASLKTVILGPIKTTNAVREIILDIAALCAKIEQTGATVITTDEREFFSYVRNYTNKLLAPVKIAA